MNETVLLLARVVLYFFVYGCVGWGVEVAFAAVTTRQLVNRGFLNGPICPIYGFGMVALVSAMQLLPKPEQTGEGANTVLVFFVGMFITTLIELVGGWVLFKLFHTRWWDYSMYRFNLGGYICPQFSLLWGLGSVLMVKVVHPLVAGLSMPLPGVPLLIVDAVLLVVFGVDVALSAAAAVGLNRYLTEIDEMRAALRRTSDRLTEVIGTNAMTADTRLDEQKLQLTLAAMESRDNVEEWRAQMNEVREHAGTLRDKLDAMTRDRSGMRRLLRAFPDMQSLEHSEAVDALRARAREAKQKAAQLADKLKNQD